MQLKLKRSQRKAERFISSWTAYAIELTVEFTAEEKAQLQKERLWKKVFYMSLERDGLFLGQSDALMPKPYVAVTLADLETGVLIESKSLENLSQGEAKIIAALKTLKTRLEASDLYQGQEKIIDLD